MTDRAEIERLLNQTGRTLEGLPNSYSVQEVDNRFEGIIGDWRFDDFVLHQSDVIELLVGALRDALAKVPRWISVKERLPEHRQHVYACAKDKFRFEGIYIDPTGFERYEIGEGWVNENRNVTNWMPLPEPTKEDAHD